MTHVRRWLAAGVAAGLLATPVVVYAQDERSEGIRTEVPALRVVEDKAPFVDPVSQAEIAQYEGVALKQAAALTQGERIGDFGLADDRGAVERARAEPIGPIFDRSGAVVGYEVGLGFGQPIALSLTRPSPYVKELQDLDPRLAAPQVLEVSNLTSLVVRVRADGTLLSIDHPPAAPDGSPVIVREPNPPQVDMRPIADAFGQPMINEKGEFGIVVDGIEHWLPAHDGGSH